jgi:peptide/nickel transport system substrate-binding protein
MANLSFKTILTLFVLTTGLSYGNGDASDETLVVPVTTITNLNPYTGNDVSLNRVFNQIAFNLVTLDDSLSPVPQLAESWTIDAQKRIITFRLKDSSFHDGSKLESKDIFSILKNSHAGGSDLTSQIENFTTCTSLEMCKSFSAMSSKVFSIQLNTANFTLFLRKLSGVESSIFKRNVKSDSFVGTGPYRIVSVSETSLDTERVDPNRPFRRIVFKKTSPSVGIQKFKSGEIDLVSNIDFDVDEKTVPNDAVRRDFLAVTFGIVFNMKDGCFFSQQNARRALELAIDREKFLTYFGKPAVTANALIPKGFLGYEQPKSVFSMEAAKSIIKTLDQSLSKNIRMGIREKFKGNAAFDVYLVSLFNELGLNLQIEYADFNTILSRFKEGAYDLILKGDTPRYYESATVFIPYVEGQRQNISSYKSSKMTDLYYKSEKSTSVTETQEILRQMEEIVRLDLPVLPLYSPVLSTWYQPTVGLSETKSYSIRLWDFPYHSLYRQKVLKQK